MINSGKLYYTRASESHVKCKVWMDTILAALTAVNPNPKSLLLRQRLQQPSSQMSPTASCFIAILIYRMTSIYYIHFWNVLDKTANLQIPTPFSDT